MVVIWLRRSWEEISLKISLNFEKKDELGTSVWLGTGGRMGYGLIKRSKRLFLKWWFDDTEQLTSTDSVMPLAVIFNIVMLDFYRTGIQGFSVWQNYNSYIMNISISE